MPRKYSKFSRKDLRSIKSQIKQFKSDQEENSDQKEEEIQTPPEELDIDINNDVVKSLIAKGFKPENITPAMIEMAENKISKGAKKKTFKKIKGMVSAEKESKTEVVWSFKPGDIVLVPKNHTRAREKDMFGTVILVEDKTASHALNYGSSYIMTPEGMGWYFNKILRKV